MNSIKLLILVLSFIGFCTTNPINDNSESSSESSEENVNSVPQLVIRMDPSESMSEEEPDFRIIPNFPEYADSTSDEDEIIVQTTEKPKDVDDYGTCPNTDRYVIIDATTEPPKKIKIFDEVEVKKVLNLETTATPIDYDSSDFGTCVETESSIIVEEVTTNPPRSKKNLGEQKNEPIVFSSSDSESNEKIDAIIIADSNENEFFLIPSIVKLGEDEISNTQYVILEEKKRLLSERNSNEDNMNLIDSDDIPSISDKANIDNDEGFGMKVASKSSFSRFYDALFSGFSLI